MVFLGKTGSGKDTQADMLQTKYGIKVIHLGDLIRGLAKADSNLADKLQKGELISDDVVDKLMEMQINQLLENDVFISDGYPRYKPQAKTLQKYLNKANAELAAVVYFNVSDSDVRLRLKLRARIDDTPDAIVRRLDQFHSHTEKVVDYFKLQAQFIEIDASKPVEEVFDQLETALASKEIITKK